MQQHAAAIESKPAHSTATTNGSVSPLIARRSLGDRGGFV